MEDFFFGFTINLGFFKGNFSPGKNLECFNSGKKNIIGYS